MNKEELLKFLDGRGIEYEKVDHKEFRKTYGTRQLTFASEELLDQKMGLIKGSITPFGLLNNDECDIHPNLNDATVFLDTQVVIDLVREHGNEVTIYE